MTSVLAPMGRRYRVPVSPFELQTKDGVRIVGARIGRRPAALVFCHGFMGWHRKGRIVRVAEALSRWFTVYAFDFRGHGRSGGLSTFGDQEILDVEAVVRMARADGMDPVVTVGGSMGGVAVVRHAALLGGVDAVAAVSTPAGWDGHGSEAVRRMSSLTGTARGRRFARALGVRLSDRWDDPASPEEVAADIAPVPLLVFHGRDDHYFDEEQAWRLYRAAREPKRLFLSGRFGHGEDGYTAGFAEVLAGRLYEALGAPWPG
jgi:pimeloyl-ACP methyl ester carboxylesterase